MNNNLSDENIILMINEMAKTDPNAFYLMVRLREATDFGDKDMIINQMNYFIKSQAATKDNGK